MPDPYGGRIRTRNGQVKALQVQVEAHFGQYPDAEIYPSQPGMGRVLGARVLGVAGQAHAMRLSTSGMVALLLGY